MNCTSRTSFALTSILAAALAACTAASDDMGSEDTQATESGDGDAGDGDGDAGDGDGDGDGDGGDGDGDGDGGDGDGDALDCEGITPAVIELTPAELDAMLDAKDFEFINVHIPYAGEIPGTDTHIAFTDIAALETELGNDVGTKAVLYCLTGPMSAMAGAALVELGYCRIYDLPAGMIGWEAEGFPVDP